MEDDGIPFDLTVAETPNILCNLEERTVGGLGIHLIKQYMDKISYQRKDDKNVLILTKIIGDPKRKRLKRLGTASGTPRED